MGAVGAYVDISVASQLSRVKTAVKFIEVAQNIPWANYGLHALSIALVWVAVWLLTRYLSGVINSLDRRLTGIDIDQREMKALDRLLAYVVITAGVIATLAILDLSRLFFSALTAAGIVTIVVAFAAKDVAANFISGIFILLDRPFVSGDVIKIADYSGTVRRISLRSTEIVTFEGPVVAIPNSKIATDPTINYSIAAQRLIEIKVAVPKDSDLGRGIQVLQDVAQSESRLTANEDITISVEDIGDYGVDLLLKCYASNETWLQVRSDLRRRIVEEFQRRGLELAVPVQKTLYSGQAALEEIPATVSSPKEP
jgi:small-conductance mechanosensitive channel